MQFYLISALFFALLVAVFAVQNTEPVTIDFLTWTFQDISLVLVILGSSVIGAVFLFLLGMVKQFSQYRVNRELTLRNNKLEEENLQLQQQVESLGATEGDQCDTDADTDIDSTV